MLYLISSHLNFYAGICWLWENLLAEWSDAGAHYFRLDWVKSSFQRYSVENPA